MALAKKCDRCGVYYDTYNVANNASKTSGFCFLNLNQEGKQFCHTYIDLCHACNDKLHHWLEHPERDGDGT